MWKCESPGQGTVIIHPFDKGFVVGYMYVGIYGYSNAEFSLKVRWSEPGDAPAEENSEIADPIFWSLREGTTFRMNEHSSSFQHVRLMTASRPFARYAQPNNLAGRLSIFSG